MIDIITFLCDLFCTYSIEISAVERFLSNDYDDGVIESKDLVIIRSGKLKGLGVLMTSYLDPKKSHQFMMWIPALRKVRRMAEPEDATASKGDETATEGDADDSKES